MTTRTGTYTAAPAAAPGAGTGAPAPSVSSWQRAHQGLDPLPGRVCVACERPAVRGTPDGFRCVDCPPTWGRELAWDRPAPGRYCLGRCYCGRCYCGRCEHYEVPPTVRPAPITVAAQVALTDLRLANALRDQGNGVPAAVMRARAERRARRY